MAAAGAPETLAQELEADVGVPELNYDLSLKITQSMRLTKLRKPDWAAGLAAKCSFADLPLKLEHKGVLKSTIMHLIDCIRDWKGELVEQELAALVLQNAMTDVPDIIRPKTAIGVPYVMNLCVLRKGESLFDILNQHTWKSVCPKWIVVTFFCLLYYFRALLVNKGSV